MSDGTVDKEPVPGKGQSTGGHGRARGEQLAYSEQMAAMLDETKRRKKAQKILAVVRHALGRPDLTGLRALDVGCSAGFIADELALAGAQTTGVDIDEPGLARARERFGDRVEFRLAKGEDLPFDDGSMDVVVFNHIYERYRHLARDEVMLIAEGQVQKVGKVINVIVERFARLDTAPEPGVDVGRNFF